MEYRELVADFAQRTLDNLDYMQAQEQAGVKGIYPVTQLWNSLLGLLVLPYEREVDRLPETPMGELLAMGWPRVEHKFAEPAHLRALIKHLRNAVAHCNVEFFSGPDDEISSLRLRNHSPNPRGRDQRLNEVVWEAVLDLSDVERIARLTAQVYVEVFKAVA